MPDGTIEIAINATTAGLTRAMSDAEKSIESFSKQTKTSGGVVKQLAGSVMSLINPATIAATAFTTLGLYLTNATKEAAAAAQINAKLEAVIKATGGAAGMSAEEIDNMSASLSKMSGVDDEVIKNSAAVMLTFREIGEDVFPTAMQAALDMSAVMGQDLQSSVVQLGKALNEPIEGVGALRRVGVQLTDQQEKQIKSFMEVNDLASAQKVILDELAMEFGGAAEAINAAGIGTENLRVSMGNLSEAIGNQLIPAAREGNSGLMDFVDTLTDVINTSAEADRIFWDNRNSMMAQAQALVDASKGQQTWNDIQDGTYQRQLSLSDAIALVTAEYQRAQLYGEAWGKLLEGEVDPATEEAIVDAKALAEATKQTTKANKQFVNDLERVAQANRKYTDGLAEAKRQLEEGKITIDEYNAKIGDLASSHEEANNQIVLSMLEMKLMADDVFSPEEMDIYIAAMEKLGFITAEDAAAIKELSKNADRLELEMKVGTKTMQNSENALRGMASAARDATGAEDNLATESERIAGRSEEAATGLDLAKEALIKAGSAARGAYKPVAGLRQELDKMPADFERTYTFYIEQVGDFPKVPKGAAGGGGGGGLCFIPGTPVTMADGSTRPIESLDVGDRVMSYDTRTGQTLSASIRKMFRHTAAELQAGYYMLINHSIGVTAEHIMYINGKWSEARDLRIGDELLDADGRPVTVASIKKIYKRLPTYNLESSHDTHNYFAGGVLVHNSETKMATGGQLGSSWTMVGERGFELISPSRHVYTHEQSVAMMRGGAAPSHFQDGGILPTMTDGNLAQLMRENNRLLSALLYKTASPQQLAVANEVIVSRNSG